MRFRWQSIRHTRAHRSTRRTLSAYLDDELPGRQRRRLEAHASICPECGPMLRKLTVIVRGLRTLPRPENAHVAVAVVGRLREEERDRPAESGQHGR